MNTIQKTLAAASLAIMSISSVAAADDLPTVQTFYDLLSNPGSESHTAAFVESTSAEWESVGDYSGKNKPRDAFSVRWASSPNLSQTLNGQCSPCIRMAIS
jgi:hypothetical protein